MRKSLVTLALAAVPALIFSACNGTGGGSGVSPSVPSAPNALSRHGRARRQDNGPSSLHSGGATFPEYGYNLGEQPVGTYNKPQAPPGEGSIFYAAPTTGTVFYCGTSSGDGRANFEGNTGSSNYLPSTAACAAFGDTPTGYGGRVDPLDFVGSDVALPSTECCAAGTPYYEYREQGTEDWGQPFELPTIGGPIVFGYEPGNFPNNKKIYLSEWSYCAIANGTIGNWNDPALTADNGGSLTGGVSEPITFYYRTGSSGTTDIFTNHLAAVCGTTWPAQYNAAPYQSASRSAAWTYGASSSWPSALNGPGIGGGTFVGAPGNAGVLAGIQTTPYSTGYLEGAWAKSGNPAVGQAYLQSGGKVKKGVETPYWVSPTSKTAVANVLGLLTAKDIVYGGGSDGNPLNAPASIATPWCQLYIPLSAHNGEFQNPPAKDYPIVGFSYWLFYGNNNGTHVADKQTLINFIATGKVNSVLTPLEYAPLSSGIETAVGNALKGNTSQTACLQ